VCISNCRRMGDWGWGNGCASKFWILDQDSIATVYDSSWGTRSWTRCWCWSRGNGNRGRFCDYGNGGCGNGEGGNGMGSNGGFHNVARVSGYHILGCIVHCFGYRDMDWGSVVRDSRSGVGVDHGRCGSDSANDCWSNWSWCGCQEWASRSRKLVVDSSRRCHARHSEERQENQGIHDANS